MSPHNEESEEVKTGIKICSIGNHLNDHSKQVTIELKAVWTSDDHIKTKLLTICNQKKTKLFTDIISTNYFMTMTRVGYGSYSEVFSAISNDREKLVYKIIPVDNKAGKNNVSQRLKSVLADSIITKSLSALRSGSFEKVSYYCENFTHLRWMNYVTSEVDRLQCDENSVPALSKNKKRYKYVINEMDDDGITLSNIKCLTPKEGIAICAQLLAAFSVAESALQFEHRDLHTSNILLSLTDATSLKYKFNNRRFEIPLYKWKVTIIDFTFSRISVGKEEIPIFTNLKRLKISKLEKGGLSTVYRLQRELLKEQWEQFNPKTNIYWLEYTIQEVLKRIDNYWNSIGVNSQLTVSEFYKILRSWKETIGGYDSCLDFSNATRLLD